jgi:hypothetical protein
MRNQSSSQNRTTFLGIFLVISLVFLLSSCGGSSAPILLYPITPHLTSTDCSKHNISWTVEKVLDQRGYSDAANVGFTDTGVMSIVTTSLRTDPPPAKLLELALEAALKTCSGTTNGQKEVGKLKVFLNRFQTIEYMGETYQEMKAEIGYKVQLLRPDGSPGHRFEIEAASIKSGGDTTHYAEPVLNEVLAKSTRLFLKRLPSAIPEVVSNSKGDVEKNVRLKASILKKEAEEEMFASNLVDNNLFAVRLTVDKESKDGKDLRIQRGGIIAAFPEGRECFALDPIKVREFNQINPLPYVVGLGAIGGVVAKNIEEKSVSILHEIALEDVIITDQKSHYSGLLFFNTNGNKSGKPMELLIEIESVNRGFFQNVTVPIQ